MPRKSHEPKVISRIAKQITEVIKKDGELSELATQITSMGYRMRCLGLDHEERDITEVGDHLYKLGCDLQALALYRLSTPHSPATP